MIRPTTSEDLDFWAILSNTDGRKLAAASKSLDSQQRSGLRHFCALRRAVPLHKMQEAQEEIIEMERATGFDEVHPDPHQAMREAWLPGGGDEIRETSSASIDPSPPVSDRRNRRSSQGASSAPSMARS